MSNRRLRTGLAKASRALAGGLKARKVSKLSLAAAAAMIFSAVPGPTPGSNCATRKRPGYEGPGSRRGIALMGTFRFFSRGDLET